MFRDLLSYNWLIIRSLHKWFGSITSRMVLYLTKWPVSINVGKDEMLLTDNLHQGFVELCNDGEASMLRIFYLEDGERRLERECIEITGLERAEDCSSLVFRICRLKSGIDCNEHVLIKPERSKDCHAIYYAFRYLQQKSTVQRKSAIEKRTLVKQLPTFRQISVTHQAYDASNLKSKNNEKTISQRVKNRNQKRKLVTSTYISLFSPSKKLTHESQKEVDSILLRPLSEQHPDELLKADDRILEINSIIPKNNNPKKKIDVNDDFLCIHNKQSSPDLSTSFERLLTGIDAVSSQGFLNLGNSCYMNAVLQGLFHIKAFEDLLNVVPESSQGTILSALKALRKNYQKATNAKKRCLLENVFKFLDDERFEITEQEAAYSIFDFHFQIMIFHMLSCGKDAQEFLTIILDKIDSELESFENSTSAERNHLFGSVTSLSSIFGFELKHEITCNKCSSKQIMYEKGVFLPIQIVHNLNNDSLSLQMLLGNYLKNEVVEHICPRCNEKYATMSHQFRTLSNREHAKLKNCFNISPPINSDISDDQVSFVLETPPNNLPSSSFSNSENKNASKTIQEINDCDDRKFPKKIIQSTKSTVVVYDSDTEEKLNYLTLFCLPQPDFCERSCAELNIRCHSSTVRQEPKPLFWKSVPSDTAPIVADGNCLFRSIALYLSGSEEEHLIVRKSVVKFEKKYSNQLREVSHFSLAEWKEHVKKMTNDGEWATEIELLALAALLDAEIWTFLNDKWLRYRPLYMVGKNGKCRKLPIQKYSDNGKNAIFLINENFHYKPVFDIISNGAISDYHLAAIISHKGISPNNGHYVCDVRNLNRNLWMHFNDSHVEEKTEAEIISECTRDGYIFFYVAGTSFSKFFFF
uniref:Ubiquitin carboxyl-terminal hydrolase n=1 Tax=Onchocerca volvulus TaxID=6282 RepID=A0A8R1XL78_ONCVO